MLNSFIFFYFFFFNIFNSKHSIDNSNNSIVTTYKIHRSTAQALTVISESTPLNNFVREPSLNDHDHVPNQEGCEAEVRK